MIIVQKPVTVNMITDFSTSAIFDKWRLKTIVNVAPMISKKYVNLKLPFDRNHLLKK